VFMVSMVLASTCLQSTASCAPESGRHPPESCW
jgi:hypothetical protein